MLLFSIAVAVVGMTFMINAAGWWSYATGAIALVGAAMLVYFGQRSFMAGKVVRDRFRHRRSGNS